MATGILLNNRLPLTNSERLYKLAPGIICGLTVLSLGTIAIKYQIVTWG